MCIGHLARGVFLFRLRPAEMAKCVVQKWLELFLVVRRGALALIGGRAFGLGAAWTIRLQ
jgi:hypothetical protein